MGSARVIGASGIHWVWRYGSRGRSAMGIGDFSVSTFHAFARRALEEFGWMIGLPSSMHLLASDVERWQRMEGVLRELRPSFFYAPTRPRREIKQLLDFISHAKQEA